MCFFDRLNRMKGLVMQSKDDFDASTKALTLLNQISLERGKAVARVRAIAEAMVRITEREFGPDKGREPLGHHPQGQRIVKLIPGGGSRD
jgi:hypothetical protein